MLLPHRPSDPLISRFSPLPYVLLRPLKWATAALPGAIGDVSWKLRCAWSEVVDDHRDTMRIGGLAIATEDFYWSLLSINPLLRSLSVITPRGAALLLHLYRREAIPGMAAAPGPWAPQAWLAQFAALEPHTALRHEQWRRLAAGRRSRGSGAPAPMMHIARSYSFAAPRRIEVGRAPAAAGWGWKEAWAALGRLAPTRNEQLELFVHAVTERLGEPLEDREGSLRQYDWDAFFGVDRTQPAITPLGAALLLRLKQAGVFQDAAAGHGRAPAPELIGYAAEQGAQQRLDALWPQLAPIAHELRERLEQQQRIGAQIDEARFALWSAQREAATLQRLAEREELRRKQAQQRARAAAERLERRERERRQALAQRQAQIAAQAAARIERDAQRDAERLAAERRRQERAREIEERRERAHERREAKRQQQLAEQRRLDAERDAQREQDFAAARARAAAAARVLAWGPAIAASDDTADNEQPAAPRGDAQAHAAALAAQAARAAQALRHAAPSPTTPAAPTRDQPGDDDGAAQVTVRSQREWTDAAAQAPRYLSEFTATRLQAAFEKMGAAGDAVLELVGVTVQRIQEADGAVRFEWMGADGLPRTARLRPPDPGAPER